MRTWQMVGAGALLVGAGFGLALVHHDRARRTARAERVRSAAERTLQQRPWAHWRGPTRNGHVSESSGYRAGSWLPVDPAWRATVGIGATSPLLSADRVYVVGAVEAGAGYVDRVSCLDAGTGAVVWRQEYASPLYGRFAMGDRGFYGGPTATPELDVRSGRLFTLSVDGELVCWDVRRDGARVWATNLYDRFGAGRRPKVGATGQQRDYGYTSSPLVDRGHILVEVGGPQANLVALEAATGAVVWRSQNTDEAGHTGSPVPIEVGGIPCVAVLTLRNLVVMRRSGPRAGQTVATFPWPTAFANNIVTPAVHGDSVILTSGYNQSAICRVRITLEGAREVWRRSDYSKVCTPVVHDGHVYFAWRRLYCLDFATGALRFRGGRFGDAGSCIVTADHRLVVWGQPGKLALVETARRSPRAYRELAARTRILPGRSWPHIVLHRGRLLCKDRDGGLLMFEPGSDVR